MVFLRLYRVPKGRGCLTLHENKGHKCSQSFTHRLNVRENVNGKIIAMLTRN